MIKRLTAILIGLGMSLALCLTASPASANYAGQEFCRSQSGASYNDGLAEYQPNGSGDTGYFLAPGQCTKISENQVDTWVYQLRGSRFRVYNNDPSSSNYQHYGPWYNIPGGRRIARLAGTTRQIVQVDK